MNNTKKKNKSFFYTLIRFTRQDWLCCASTIIISPLLALVIHSCSSLLPEDSIITTILNDANEEWYINSFFSKMNHSVDHMDNSDIVILDVKDSYSSRENIAEIIKKTATYKPKLIFIDFLFSESDSFDKEQNNILRKVITDCKDSVNIVFGAYKYLDEPISQSFFMDSLSLKFGLTNYPSFHKFIPYKDTIPRVTTVLAKELGIDIENLPNPLVINYRRKLFDSRAIDDYETANDNIRENLRDKIVLIGQNDAPVDIHTAPFIIKDGKKTPGIEILAYELSSLINYNEEENIYRHPYEYYSLFQNFIIFISALVFYLLFLNRLYLLNKGKNVLFFIISKIVWLFLSEFIVIIICFNITEHWYKIPNIVLLIVSMLYVEPVYEISIYLTNKCYGKKKI